MNDGIQCVEDANGSMAATNGGSVNAKASLRRDGIPDVTSASMARARA